ncbi:MAG TPA: YifB family Mg chelatase-like AAA ATPase [Bacillota bacterium]|nr:YifB family Mg chelatase-like AAA ATPase [Bacillota bacterium]
MLAKSLGCTLVGVQARLVEVEVDVSPGVPAFDLVGLPDSPLREARERVRAAIRNSGLEFPLRRITVNLAPADLRKEGSGLDLPIAAAILAATGQVGLERLGDWVLVGELALDGRVKAVTGILPMALAARAAGLGGIVVPQPGGAETIGVEGVQILGVESLAALAGWLEGRARLRPPNNGRAAGKVACPPDFADVAGQRMSRRALEIVAAGSHHCLLIGPPGAGKTMLARRLPGILPELSPEDTLEATIAHSVAGLLPPGAPAIAHPPFRSPHHSVSVAGLMGGGRPARPGEVTLAHCGVLFLDEFPEFHREAREALREPLEEGTVNIVRAGTAVTYPARFLLVAAMNSCPCGHWGDLRRSCLCSPPAVLRYRARISGPLLDRIDLQVNVPRLEYHEIQGRGQSEGSAAIRDRVLRARAIQRRRFGNSGPATNGRMGPGEVRSFCRLSAPALAMVRAAFEQLGLSLRAHDRILKVARTIADLDGAGELEPEHLGEAIQYRWLDRDLVS